MGGGLMQLVAYGAQDIYLTGNPQITFFKVVYRRHTNFSMEAIQQTFSGSNGVNPVCTISRNGDLVHKMYLVSTTNTHHRYTKRQIQTVELEIGGQRIDRQSGRWMDTWNELSTPESKAIGLKSMTGQIGANGTGVNQVHIPLLFWFCRNPGLALPLIALQYHEVKVKFTLESSNNGAGFELYCDYIYLDTDERRRFAQVSHEYLIEQVQEQSTVGAATSAVPTSNKLNFNHPVKELIWSTTVQPTKVGLKLNGHDRFSEREDEHFYLQQPYDYHTAVPKQNLPAVARITLLDRLTTFTPPTAIPTVMLVAAPENVTASGSNFHLASTGVLNISGTDGTVKADDFPIGTQLALTFVTRGDAGDITGNGTTAASAIGDLYFATVTVGAGENVTDVLTMTISTPTSLTGKFFTGAADTGTGSDTSISVLLVTNANAAQARTSRALETIGVYSFALKPEEHQPSGTCNFSRIDNAELNFTGGTGLTFPSTDVIYAVNYNVLRIMSGMGGLAYSN